jgi:hypothetical protein
MFLMLVCFSCCSSSAVVVVVQARIGIMLARKAGNGVLGCVAFGFQRNHCDCCLKCRFGLNH